MSMKKAYEQKLQSKLDEWSAQVDILKAKADSAEADAKLEYQKQIDDLRAKQDSARDKLDELKEAGEDAWQDLKAGIESAWDSLGSSVDSAMSRFKN